MRRGNAPESEIEGHEQCRRKTLELLSEMFLCFYQATMLVCFVFKRASDRYIPLSEVAQRISIRYIYHE